MSRAARTLARGRKAAGYLGRPALLARKLARAWRRRASERAYRDALAHGGMIEVPAAAPAEVFLSVAMPVHRVAEAHLRAAIASVRAQTHPSWELLLLDDASPDPHVARVLAEAARDDRRIRAQRRASNGGIAVASNEIIRQARGEMVAFLDHDDLLHPRALELAARILAGAPETDWIFTDEDKLDEHDRHHEPCLKPGWSHHLLLAFNYVAHLRIVRRALLERLGGHREGLDGAQDYDLALRAAAAGARFAHLPGVLYHWRTVPASMARLAGAKPLAHRNAVRALAEHACSWPRGGEVSAAVLLEPASLFRVRRAPEPGLSIEVAAERPVDLAGWIDSLRTSRAGVAVLPPAGGLSAGTVEELVALLNVPGTAVAAGRGVTAGRVSASGWVVSREGAVRDPWEGLATADPGYLNLAMVAGPRALPPPTALAAWRGPLLAAWDAAADTPSAWRLAVGLERCGFAAVTTPEVSHAVAFPPTAPAAPPPAGLPPRWSRWLDELGLAP